MEIASADLAPIRDLYGQGMYLQAYAHAQRLGPLGQWSGAAARVLAGRLAIQLGAPRLGRWLHLKAFRATPTHPEAIYYHARYRLERFGPLAAWFFLREHPDWSDAPPEQRADWYGLNGFVAARLRDFDRAERWLNRAEALTPDKPWLCIERAACLEFAERLGEALEAGRRSLALQEWFRPGVQTVAHILTLLNRDREALELLAEADARLESGIVTAQLAALQTELGLYHDARRSYDRYAELSPLLEPEMAEWLAARRADTLYSLGDWRAARDNALRADDPFYAAFAERLRPLAEGAPPPPGGAPGRVLELAHPTPDPFAQAGVPALLAHLARHWGKELPEPSWPESLPLDGLPDGNDRLWAERNGFAAREFTVTPAAAEALIGRGVPFLITVIDGGFGHTQLAVGYDPLRESVRLRGPYDRVATESPLAPLLQRYRGTGPRGLALVPAGKAGLLEGLELPDADLYDRAFEVQAALQRHDRPAAWAAYEALRAAAPGHRLALQARCAIARYDAHPTELLLAVEPLLALFPNDTTFLLTKLAALRDLGRREERLEMLEGLCRRFPVDPLFAQHYAQSLLAEGRQVPGLELLLRRAAQKRPFAASVYYIYANLLWERRAFAEAAELYRFAACLDERDEQLTEAYFRAARATEQLPEAMRFLQQRFRRAKHKHAAATRALFQALAEQEEMDAAFEVLEQGLHAGPPAGGGPAQAEREGELLLFAAGMRANYDEPERAEAILESARGKARPGAWRREAARLAALRVDLPRAIGLWREVLAEEPTSAEAHRALARLLGETEGRAAALAYLADACARLPFCYPLAQLRLEWLRAEGAAEAEPAARALVERCPEDAWARRELALHLAALSRFDEALAELEAAGRLDPRNPSYFYTLGHVLHRADRVAEAREAYRRAVRLSVDNEVAVHELVATARGQTEQQEALEFLAGELKRQPHVTDGVFVFRDEAVNLLEPDELLALFQHLLDEHPDTWQVWSVTVQQLAMMGRLEEAQSLARQAVERFPLLARLWVDLAEVCEAQQDAEGNIEALREAVRVSPGWGPAARALAEALEENGQSDEARAVLEQAVARAPFDPVNHGYLAEALWNLGECEEALDRVRLALRLDPGYEWAWRTFGEWAERLECPQRLTELAREVARLRPGDARAWLALSRVLTGPEEAAEALEALDRAIALNPRGVEAYDLKAERLAELGRFDEAKAATNPEVFAGDPPMILQGRAAWVEAKRGNYAAAIPPMQALVALEPNYYWGWWQLAEWLNETGKAPAYLEAASEMVRLRPDSPVALAYRGEARLQTGDRAAGKADLRQATQIAPNYAFAGMLLFDACLADGELDAARAVLAVLQEHIGGPFVVARQAQLAAEQKDREHALDALRELCETESDALWPVQSAAQALRAAGWSEDVDAILRRAWESGGPFHPWAALAWVEGPEGSRAAPEERLRALDRVLEVNPRFAQAYDLKAEQLARLGRHDEALAACSPPALGDPPPLVLRGRAAWVLWARGDRSAALERMRAALAEDADYYWGWYQLANWLEATGAYRDYLGAAENLVRLAPQEPASYGYRGEARWHLGDRAGAREDFARAQALDPKYAYAGLRLFEMQLEAGDIDAAAATLARLEEHVLGPEVRFAAVRLAAARGDAEEALDALECLATDPAAAPAQLRRAAELVEEKGWGEQLRLLLEELLEDEEAHPMVGRLWMERALARSVAGAEERLPALLKQGEVGREALVAYVEAQGSPEAGGRLCAAVQQYGEVLRATGRAWAKTGEAIAGAGKLSLAIAWLADWREREGLEPWMLVPLARALRAAGRCAEAEQVSRHALSLPPDASTPYHAVWVALEDALAGRCDDACRRLRDVDAYRLDDTARLLYSLAEALVMVQRAPPDGRGAAFAEARDHLRTARGAVAGARAEPGLAGAYRRCVTRLARDAGGLRAWLWNLRHRLWTGLR